MKRIRMVALALVAVFAMTALASSASAAGPVFYTKAELGSTVTKTVGFKATLGAGFLEAKGGTKIACKTGSGSGETSGATTVVNDKILFSECESGGLPCENVGSGKIETKTLAGNIGNVVAAKTPGVRLFSESAGRGGVLAEFECGAGVFKAVVTGSVIGSTTGSGKTPAEGKFAATLTLSYTESKGIQKYSKFIVGEGEAGEEQLEVSISGHAIEKSGQSVSAKLTSIPASNLGITL